MIFKDCVYDGNITGSWSSVGGFVGAVTRNTDLVVNISGCINNGNVTGKSMNIGGFVGIIYWKKQQ